MAGPMRVKALTDALVRAGLVSANDLNQITKITIVLDPSTSPEVLIHIVRVDDNGALVKALDEFKESGS